ncbi:MAG: hypothetical protein A3J51_06935 [Omnitrophica WOR_2 bacterium RIFCSPHIGHO2_02_FULL_45_21]|nr:MAG: hypothetical protein A3J51_06935 [Omnitrophica WOR_2 bacterium RIFCSPHIGHO2_02_FULL_45_21]
MMINIIPVKNKEVFLLGILATMVMLIEGQLFLSKPKLSIDRQGLFEQFSRDNFRAEKGSVSIKNQKGDPYPEIIREKDNPLTQALELELLGTAVGNVKDPIAFIKDLRAGKQGICRLGSVVRDARVIEITLGEVILDVNGRKEILRLSKRALSPAKKEKEAPAIVSVSADYVTVSKKGIFNEMGAIMNALPKLKIKPYYEASRVSGMMVEGVTRDSIIAAAGIQDKDVVKAVNSQKINSYQKALQVLYKARNQSEINVDLLRGGQAKSLSYRITN